MRRVLWGIVFVFFAFSVKGCDQDKRTMYYKMVSVPPIAKNQNGTLTMIYPSENGVIYLYEMKEKWELKGTFTDKNTSRYLEIGVRMPQNYNPEFMGDYTIRIDPDTTVSFKHQNVKVQTNNHITFQAQLPSLQTVSNALNLTSSAISYEYFPFAKKQYEWNNKEFLVTIYTGKEVLKSDSEQDTCLYGYLYYDDVKGWIIAPFDMGTSECVNFRLKNHTIDGSNNVCFHASYGMDNGLSEYCLTYEIDGSIRPKKLYGEIYPQGYKQYLDQINQGRLSYTENATFDEKGNMHLFYNKPEDFDRYGNYTYFWYGYFTKENPTTPLFEQKVYWK